MRIILSALFILFGLLFGIQALEHYDIFHKMAYALVGLCMIVYFVGLLAASMWLFDYPPAPWRLRKTKDDIIRELEGKGLITEHTYRARRAFAIEEFEDEGSQYVVELVDGRVLFLCGQYLYDYEPFDEVEEDEPPVVRQFPCTEFVIRKHKEDDYVLDIICDGDVLEPECTAPPLTPEMWESDDWPDDGEFFEGITYDEIKAQLLGA